PDPTDSTTPAPSAPTMWGSCFAPPGNPSTTKRSRWLSAAERIATRTSPAPGTEASGTSVLLSLSIPPVAVRTQARMAPSPVNLGPERRGDHLLQADRRQRDRGRR